jgi:spoIIIJ-associated protein
MKSVESSGKTIDEAILMAVAQLGVQRDNLEIEVLEEPVKGLFGIIGARDAKIRATVKKTLSDQVKEFLMKMLELMKMEATIDIVEKENQINIEIKGAGMGLLIGHRGETLDAIQYLVSLFINKETGEYKRVIVDTENYRSKREETLKKLAKRLAHKVAKTRKKVTLEPMNPYERRIIHSTLQNDQYVKTYSEGEEPFRRVVISLK